MAAIVTQPPARRDRGKKLMPSPVAEFALDTGFPSDLIFTPERAGEVILVVFVWEFVFFLQFACYQQEFSVLGHFLTLPAVLLYNSATYVDESAN